MHDAEACLLIIEWCEAFVQGLGHVAHRRRPSTRERSQEADAKLKPNYTLAPELILHSLLNLLTARDHGEEVKGEIPICVLTRRGYPERCPRQLKLISRSVGGYKYTIPFDNFSLLFH